MFNYFKYLKQGRSKESADNLQEKPKTDKAFIAILIIFGLIILISLITGIADVGKGTSIQEMNYRFQFHISDGVILAGLLLAYFIVRHRKGKK